MKKNRFIFLLGLSVLMTVLSCSDTNEKPAPSGKDGAVVNGDPFTPTDIKGSTLADGLELVFTDADNQQINLRLSDNVAGTYAVQDANPGGRVKGDMVAFVMFVDTDGEVFYGTDGSLVIKTVSNGKISGTFSFNAQSSSGSVTTITKGNFTSTYIAPLPSGKCLLTRVVSDDGSTEDYSYNSEGQLVRVVNQDGPDYVATRNYIWVGDHVVKVYRKLIDGDNISTRESSWVYKAGKLEKITENKANTYNGVTSKSTGSYTFTYNSEGKVAKADWSHVSGGDTSGGSNAIEYNANGNVIKITYTEENNNLTTVFSGYDTKKSWYSLLAEAVNNPGYFPKSFESMEYSDLSINNPGSAIYTGGFEANVTYVYTYNTQGYPTLITETYDSETYQHNFIYSGCD